jgi:hypothetical protein
MNYPTIYNLQKLRNAVEKDASITLNMTAAAAIVGTFPATITRARKGKRLVEVKRPFTKRSEVTGKSLLEYFEEINQMARIVKVSTPKKKKAAVAKKKVAPVKKPAVPVKKAKPAPKKKPAPKLKEPAFGNGRGQKPSGNLLTKAVAKKK